MLGVSQPELGDPVGVQKGNRADSLKRDIMFLPRADLVHYTTRSLFHYRQTCPGGQKHLIFHLGSYLALSQLIE